jgi:hypothetical protein
MFLVDFLIRWSMEAERKGGEARIGVVRGSLFIITWAKQNLLF